MILAAVCTIQAWWKLLSPSGTKKRAFSLRILNFSNAIRKWRRVRDIELRYRHFYFDPEDNACQQRILAADFRSMQVFIFYSTQ